MNITIQKSSVPIPRQLEQQVKQLIWANSLTPGTQLPTVRELAGFLRVNRNTVARAYKTLEHEGFLVTQGARGTFVSDTPPQQPLDSVVREFLAETLRTGAELGMDAHALALALLTHAQTLTQAENAETRRLLVIECNLPQLLQLQAELEAALPVQVDTLLLDEVSPTPANISEYAAVVTTFFHAEEVKGMLAEAPVELVTLLFQEDLPTLLRLRQLPPGTHVALICDSEHGLLNMRRSVLEAGLAWFTLRGALISDSAAVAEALAGVQAVVCSSHAVQNVLQPMLPPEIEILVDDQTLDRQGIETLRRSLML